MKYRNLILLAILSINLASCDDEPTRSTNCSNLEEATQEGKNTMSFFRNGECYKATFLRRQLWGIQYDIDEKFYQGIGKTDLKSFKNRNDVYDVSISMEEPVPLTMLIKGLRFENNVPIYELMGFSTLGVGYGLLDTSRYRTYTYSPDKLFISKVKLVKDSLDRVLYDESFISGTFTITTKEFTRDSTATFNYTDGRFDVKVGIKK